MRIAIVAALLVTGALCARWGPSSASPSDASTPALPADAVITYVFTDSSVPPPYHRSWKLTVTAEQSAITVLTYGSVLAQRSAATATGVWDLLARGFPSALESADLAARRTTPEGCTGGTAEAIRVAAGPAVLVDQSVYNCGGTNADVAEAFRAWIAPARSQFPPTDVLAPPG